MNYQTITNPAPPVVIVDTTSTIDQVKQFTEGELPRINLYEAMRSVEMAAINKALTQANGNKARAASMLGINRTTLVEKIRRMKVPNEQ